MKSTFLILALLFSTETLVSKNLFDSLEIWADTKTERKILRKFKKSKCFRSGTNPNIRPHDNYKVQVMYGFTLKEFDEKFWTSDSLFLENLRKTRSFYIIYNDSLVPVASFSKSLDRCYHHKMKINVAPLYAMRNQYVFFHAFSRGLDFGYKDGRVFVFTGGYYNDLKVILFEEFDWDEWGLPQLLNYRRTAGENEK
jgi:hypothetical protein